MESQSTLYMLQSSYVYRTTRHSTFNTSRKLSSLVHSCRRGIVHFPAHKTTLLTITLRHSNTINNMMNADSAKGKKRKPKDSHITLVTNPTKLVQPYKTTSSEHMLPNGDKSQHKKIKPDDAAPNANTSLQSSIPLKPASLPGLIVVNKSSAVVSQQTSLLTNSGINIDMSLTQISDPNFCHIISQCIKLQVFCRCKFYNKEHHGTYNKKPTSFCGMVLKYCNIIANKAWWYNTRKMIDIRHTNHRNNCIKAVKLKYKGKPFQHKAHKFCNLTNIVQFERVHYQKDAPNQPQPSNL